MASFQHLEHVLKEYQTRFDALGEVQAKLGELTATATAPRQVVKVTVGAHGQVRDIAFPTRAYRQLTPAELSKALLETIEQARAEADAKTADLLGPVLPGGLSAEDVMAGRTDLGAVVGQDAWMSDVRFPDPFDQR